MAGTSKLPKNYLCNDAELFTRSNGHCPISQFHVQFQCTAHIKLVSLFRLFSAEKSPLNPAQRKVQCT